MQRNTTRTRIVPEAELGILSHAEVARLKDTSQGGLHRLFRQCSLAVMTGGHEVDNTKALLEKYRNFDIQVIPQDRGIKLEVLNAPVTAFVDGEMIESIKSNLFSVLRDVIYISNEIKSSALFDLSESDGITNAVFHILRNGAILKPMPKPNRVVCWGGHSIAREEYDYSKVVGHELGLRYLNVITGCGPGAMKGPMKGAQLGHAKQRYLEGEYIGITEPGIIAAEAPNPVVNRLVVMPDMEKRLEAFIRTGHGIIVFPGGVGTAEEILYLLGVLSDPENAEIPFPLVFTGPKSASAYFEQIDRFIGATLGPGAQKLYKIIVDDPAKVAKEMRAGISKVRAYRKERSDAYYFNWRLHIPLIFQEEFHSSHEEVSKLQIHRDQPVSSLAAQLRRAFSAIVSGNVKESGISAIEAHGPFEIRGDADLMGLLDDLLRAFVIQGRMKIQGQTYVPCYKLIC